MKGKSIIAVIVAAALMCSILTVAAEDEVSDGYTRLAGADLELAINKGDSLSFNAAAVILVENKTGISLYEANADQPRAIASITKVMTIILVMEAIEAGKIKLDDRVSASTHAYETGGAQIWLEPGEVMTVDELLRAVTVASANDAAVALAEYVGGSEEEFVSMMNERAKQLGMTKTTFKNCNGLDEEGHISCARDVAAMSREVLRHELVRKYITIWQDELRGGETELTNTNKLLKRYDGITGIKTGTTDDAGVCITASAERNGMELIAVVLGSPSGEERFQAATTLLNYGFANFEVAKIDAHGGYKEPKVSFGTTDNLQISYTLPEHVVVEKGKAQSVSVLSDIREKVEAPIKKGDVVGEIRVFCEKTLIYSTPVLAAGDVPRLTFKLSAGMLLKELIKM